MSDSCNQIFSANLSCNFQYLLILPSNLMSNATRLYGQCVLPESVDYVRQSSCCGGNKVVSEMSAHFWYRRGDFDLGHFSTALHAGHKM